jgi:hypothetical protein
MGSGRRVKRMDEAAVVRRGRLLSRSVLLLVVSLDRQRDVRKSAQRESMGESSRFRLTWIIGKPVCGSEGIILKAELEGLGVRVGKCILFWLRIGGDVEAARNFILKLELGCGSTFPPPTPS